MAFQTLFNPLYQAMPSELEDVLFDHELDDKTLDDLAAINSHVLIDTADEFSDDDTVARFVGGGYTNIVLSAALKGIKKREPYRVTLKVIQLYHLNEYFKLEELIEALEARAEKEIADCKAKAGIHK